MVDGRKIDNCFISFFVRVYIDYAVPLFISPVVKETMSMTPHDVYPINFPILNEWANAQRVKKQFEESFSKKFHLTQTFRQNDWYFQLSEI